MKIHTTIGVYNNGSFKINGVCETNLQNHIWFNKTYRFGRALFVDGKCVHNGYLDDERIKNYENLFKGNKEYIKTKDTQPYE